MEGTFKPEYVRNPRAERWLTVLVLATTALLLASLKVRPLLVLLLAAAGAGVVILLVLQPAAAVCVLAFLAYGHFSAAFLPGVFSALLGAAFLAWLIRVLLNSESTISATRVDLALLLYVSTLLISMVFSRTPEEGGPHLLLMARWLVFYVLMVNIVRSESLVVKVSAFVLLGALASGVVGLWGFSQERLLVRLGSVFRASGLASNPNELAIVMITAIPISAYMMGVVRGRLVRACFFAAIVVLVAATIVTLARTGLMGMLIVFLVIAVRERRSRWVKIGVLLFVLILPILIPPEFWLRLAGGSFFGGDYSSLVRSGAMRAGVRMFAENPITGVGLGTYLGKSTQYGDIIFPLVAHNMFLHVLVENGILGLGAMLFLVGSVLRNIRLAEKTARSGSPLFYLARGYQASYVAYLFSGLFTSIHFNQSFWFLAAASVFLLQAARRQSAVAGTPRAGIERELLQ
ncbi:MAG: O-antigen ligase family protein [Candidatus Eiseniibacteriota bacterium]|nr:MAG: O-antigen ligase family protein [Candidatus Eisenbacteria bacterium]